MAFLDRVANGGGSLEREYAVGRGRMDLCLRLGGDVLGIELKVWRDGRPDPTAEGLEQLDGYLAGLGLDGGWVGARWWSFAREWVDARSVVRAGSRASARRTFLRRPGRRTGRTWSCRQGTWCWARASVVRCTRLVRCTRSRQIHHPLCHHPNRWRRDRLRMHSRVRFARPPNHPGIPSLPSYTLALRARAAETSRPDLPRASHHKPGQCTQEERG